MWKYNLKEKLHAWFENEREQESAFGELKINQAWRVMYIPVFFFFSLSRWVIFSYTTLSATGQIHIIVVL